MQCLTYNYSRIVLSCMETCVVKGVTIPEGTKVVIPINLIHHNDELWETPDAFLPDRYELYLHGIHLNKSCNGLLVIV